MQLVPIDLEERFNPLRVIKNAEIMDKNRSFTDDGLYSERIFGTINGDDIEYNCKCGELRGKIFEGITCEKCKTTVERKQSVISRMGWIDLGSSKIINPLFLPFMFSYIGTSKLKKYLYDNMAIDVDGNIQVANPDENASAKEPLPECIGMGVTQFIENFDSILEVFHSKNKEDKKDIYEFLRLHRDKLFVSKIPVYSPRLRPVVVIKDKVITDPLNEKYVQIIKLVSGLQNLQEDRTILAESAFVNKIQSLLEEVNRFVIMALNGKKGLIRNTVLGSRMNWTSRCVITPLPIGTELDEVHMPYIVCLELFKLEILNYLRKKKDISYFEAMTEFNDAVTVFNQEIYDFMMCHIGPNGKQFLLNRNPTIAIGSILCMRITKIKEDITDVTMSIRNNVLKFLSGDYDGDVLNVFLTLITKYEHSFRKFSPKEFVFSMNDGKFNRDLSLTKDYSLGLQILLL